MWHLPFGCSAMAWATVAPLRPTPTGVSEKDDATMDTGYTHINSIHASRTLLAFKGWHGGSATTWLMECLAR